MILGIFFNDIIIRWGGEEFVLILIETDLNRALTLANRLKEKIHNNFKKTDFDVTCSFGVATIKHKDNVTTIINRADILLYKAKQQGKNQVVGELDRAQSS